MTCSCGEDESKMKQRGEQVVESKGFSVSKIFAGFCQCFGRVFRVSFKRRISSMEVFV